MNKYPVLIGGIILLLIGVIAVLLNADNIGSDYITSGLVLFWMGVAVK